MLANEQTKKRGAIAIAVVAVAIAALIAYLAFVNASYTQQRTQSDSAESEAFYFTSDVLVENDTSSTSSPQVIYTQKDTTGDYVSISLNNFDDSLRYTTVANIPYKYTVQKDTSGGDPIGALADTKSSSDTQLKNDAVHSVEEKMYISTDFPKDNKYYVQAVAKTDTDFGTYQKTLTRTILVSDHDKSFHAKMETSRSGAYVEVTVWNTGNTNTAFKITYPSAYIPDNSDAKMKTWTNSLATGNEGSCEIAVDSCHVFRFFKAESTHTSIGDVQNATGSGAYVALSAS